MKKYLSYSLYIFAFFISLIFAGSYYFSLKLPDFYHVDSGESLNFSVYPFSVVSERPTAECISSIIDSSGKHESYSGKLMFMNLFPMKSVKIDVSESKKVVPCGVPFGVKLYTKGAVIVGTSSVKSENEIIEPWNLAGIKKGDVIVEGNGKEILNNDDLEEIIQNSNGDKITFKIIREDSEFSTDLKPIKSVEDNKYRIGAWVRDSSAGIGTLTFFDSKNKTFAGLGHGVCDVDTSELLPLAHGDIVEASITSVVKSFPGIPGELKGCFINPEPIGSILVNNETGLYGKFSKNIPFEKEISVSPKQNVKKGAAKILTTIEGGNPMLYDINIDSINYDVTIPTKNMKISVTDPKLIEKTGGIVQGMSGSPIIQNGYLVGAVTHVFVNNPTRGYAIFAETMTTNSNFFLNLEYKNIS